MPRPAIEFSGISKRFGGVVALSGVDLHVYPGEVLALVGENGAGKSTLLSILSGHLTPDSGAIALDGATALFAGPRDATATGIHVVRQEPTLFPDLTVAENVLAGALPTRARRLVRQREITALAGRRLAAAGLADLVPLRTPVRDLGPGDRQLVEIAKALTHAGGVKVIAFDEPTSSLTADNVQRLYGIVERLRTDGVAVIYVSHRMHETFQVADRIAVLRDGHNVGVLTRADTTDEALVRLMVGRDLAAVTRRVAHEQPSDAAPRTALQLRGLSGPGLQPADLHIRAGEILGVAGLVKAGRSRLARTIFGVIPHTAGDVVVNGAPIRLRSPHDALRSGIVLVPEDRQAQGLITQRSIKENVTLGQLKGLRRGRIINGAAEARVVRDLADRLRIKTPSIDAEVNTLSGGNQQKVVLARAIARRPSVLLLDEPTRGVDVGAKAEIYELIRDLAAGGTAVLLISSELPELLTLSDRIIVMRSGQISGELTAEDATEEGLLRLAMPTPTAGVA